MSKKVFYDNINGSLFWNNKLVGGWQRPGGQGLVHTGYQHTFGSEDDYRLVPTGSRHSFWSEDDERLVPPAVGTRSGGSRRSHWCPSGGGGVGVGPATFIKISKNCCFSQKGLPSTGVLKLVHKKKKICLHIVILELAYPNPHRHQFIKPIGLLFCTNSSCDV